MDFKFSVDEFVVVVSALRQEYRRACECAIIARRKQASASKADVALEFMDLANKYDERCAKCAEMYKKFIDRDILEDL